MKPTETMVDDVPVLALEPTDRTEDAPLALWLPWLSGTKEACLPMLEQLAAAGFVAVSLDPWRQGARATESADAIAERVFANFRREMWPALGHTTLDALRVIDWALDSYGRGGASGANAVVVGGVSMGGDVAVALAGIDPRISRVAAVVATPDWTRPGMRELTDPSSVLPQGEADALARWYYEHLDPMTHIAAYAHTPAITFECAGDDQHVPAEAARRFQAAFAARFPDAPESVRVNLHPGYAHLDGARAPEPSANALAWLSVAAPVGQS